MREAVGPQPKQHERAEQRQHARVEKAQRRHPLAVHNAGPMHPVHGLVGDRAVVAESLDVQQTSIGLKADLPQGGEVCQPTPERKVRVSLMVVSVRSARPSLWYCLMRLCL